MSHGKDIRDDITCLVSNMGILPVDEKKVDSCPIPSDDDFIMHPNEYEIVAFVDISLVTKDVSEEDIRAKFGHSKVEIQSLRIGDCIWVAQRHCITTTRTKDKTLVLPYIAFKDDKLLEEKFRSQCRDCGFKRVLRIKETSLCPLANSVHVAHNIHRIGDFHYFETVTGSQIGTIGYLADLTSRLNESFQGKSLRSCRRVCLPHLFSSQPNTIPLVTCGKNYFHHYFRD